MARLEGDPPAGGRRRPGGPAAPGGVPGAGPTVPRCAGKRATIVGTARRDLLRGTRRADVIVALGGNDRVKPPAATTWSAAGPARQPAGESGRDRLLGGPGNDHLTGGPGNDRLLGQSGRDRLLGGAASTAAGGGGRDSCAGGVGRDRVRCEAKRSV